MSDNNRALTRINVDFSRAMCRQNARDMWHSRRLQSARQMFHPRRSEPASYAMSMEIEASSIAVADVVRRILEARAITQPVRPHDDLREVGLTSLDMVSLVLSVEAEFGIKVPEREITPANFRSIATIETLVDRLRR
jgi:acyl carrier protein